MKLEFRAISKGHSAAKIQRRASDQRPVRVQIQVVLVLFVCKYIFCIILREEGILPVFNSEIETAVGKGIIKALHHVKVLKCRKHLLLDLRYRTREFI